MSSAGPPITPPSSVSRVRARLTRCIAVTVAALFQLRSGGTAVVGPRRQRLIALSAVAHQSDDAADPELAVCGNHVGARGAGLDELLPPDMDRHAERRRVAVDL